MSGLTLNLTSGYTTRCDASRGERNLNTAGDRESALQDETRVSATIRMVGGVRKQRQALEQQDEGPSSQLLASNLEILASVWR